MTKQNDPSTSPAANETGKKKKAKKPKGPIRWEAIGPFVIVTLLIWAYFFFFFDSHLRRAMEYVGTHANGAEVNIGRLKTSFWNASLEIDKIQVTDLDQPQKNKIQVGQVRWKMLWDALLRGKIAIEDASILEIAVGVPRARPGRVLPPDPPGSKSAFDKIREQALAQAEQQFSKNILGDVAAILGGVDPSEQLKNIEGQLKSSARVKELESALKEKEQEWKQRLASLPQNKDIQAFETKLKSVKTSGFKNPAELQASLSEINNLYKELDSTYKNIQGTSKALGTDVTTYKNSLTELDAMIRQDIKDLENRLKIPKLDAKSISESVFGPLFLNRVKQAEFYMAKARQFMPPKKTAEQKAEFQPPKPRERETGRNYKFGKPNSYPLFWLKHAALSSKYTSGADWSGNLSGALIDVTDDMPTLGRPTRAQFKGDFPKQELFGIDGELTIDHVTEVAAEKLALKVASFPVLGQSLVKSSDVTLGFGNAQASGEFNAELRGGEISLTTNNTFQKKAAAEANVGSTEAASTSFLMATAKQPVLDSILKGALADIRRVTLNAGVKGPWTALRFNVNSNLGEELTRAFDKQIQLKIAEARAKLQNLVDEQVGKQRERLQAEFNKVNSQVNDVIKSKQAEVDKVKSQIDNAKNQAANDGKKRLENEGKKAIDKFKGKLGF